MLRRQLLFLAVITFINIERGRPAHQGLFIDIDDILNENLMPASLFTMDSSTRNNFAKDSNISRSEFFNITTKPDFSSAFSTMKFHRKMMNEYQATSFLAHQVLDDFMKPPENIIEKRIGQGKEQNMLFDQGSEGYKNWLEKTTTLDDVQNHFKNRTARRKNHDFKRRQGFDYSDYEYYDDNEKIDFSEGEISGFAIQNTDDSQTLSVASDKVFFAHPTETTGISEPIFAIPTVHSLLPKSGHGWKSAPTGNSHGWSPPPTGHDSWDDGGGGGHTEIHESTEKKELGFKEIVDVALTTLAFLSFGMFFLQVILCITMNKEDSSSTMMMMPMEANPQMTDFDIVEEIRRRKRETVNPLENVSIWFKLNWIKCFNFLD